MYTHTIPFICNMIFRYLANICTFVEYNSRVSAADGSPLPPPPTGAKAFFAVQGIATFTAPVCWILCYNAYEAKCGVQVRFFACGSGRGLTFGSRCVRRTAPARSLRQIADTNNRFRLGLSPSRTTPGSSACR